MSYDFGVVGHTVGASFKLLFFCLLVAAALFASLPRAADLQQVPVTLGLCFTDTTCPEWLFPFRTSCFLWADNLSHTFFKATGFCVFLAVQMSGLDSFSTTVVGLSGILGFLEQEDSRCESMLCDSFKTTLPCLIFSTILGNENSVVSAVTFAMPSDELSALFIVPVPFD